MRKHNATFVKVKYQSEVDRRHSSAEGDLVCSGADYLYVACRYSVLITGASSAKTACSVPPTYSLLMLAVISGFRSSND